MANNNRDVNLIIRAKNEASKTLGGVTDAIKLLQDAQDKLATSAGNVDTSLNDLETELSSLKTAGEAAESLKKVEGVLATMGATVAKMKGELESAQSELGDLGARSQQTAKQIADLEAAKAALTARQQAEKAAAEEASRAAQKQAAAYRELAQAKSALNKAMKLPGDAEGRAATISAAQSQVGARQAAYDGTLAISAQAKERLDATNKSIKEISENIKALRKEEASLVAQIEKTNTKITEQTAAIDKAQTEFGTVSADFAKASSSLNAFGITADTVEAKTAALTAEIQRLQSVQKGIGRYSTGDGGFADPRQAGTLQKLNADRNAALETQRLLQAEAKALSQEIARSSGNVTVLVDRFKAVTSAARQAKLEAASINSEMMKVNFIGPPVPSDLAARQARITAEAEKKLAAETKARAAAQKYGTVATKEASQALKEHSDGTRTAMGLQERFRAQILSLASAFIGVYGLIEGVGATVKAYQQLEAAQNRLGVVFGDNSTRIRREIQWLQGEAGRLGIEFGILSDQYTKFAVSAKAANFSAAATRKVFMAVAEAGRVNKLSMDDMNGVFLALTQMIQKGKISAEELRGQMAERLPSAIVDMAAAFGYGTDQLDEFYKAMADGNLMVSESTMLAFGDALNDRYGAQLQASLEGVTAQIGRFRNELFQAMQTIGNAGLMDGFTNMLQSLNDFFASKAGNEFFQSIGAAAGKFFNAVAAIIPYVKEIAFLLQVAFGVMMLRKLVVLIDFPKIVETARTAMFAFVIASKALGSSMQGAAAAVGVFGTSLKAMLMSTGVGALLVIASTFGAMAFNDWAGGVDTATAAMEEHNRILRNVLEQYDQVKDKAGQWGEIVKSVSLPEADANLVAQMERFKAARQNLADANIAYSVSGLSSDAEVLNRLSEAFNSGGMSIDQYLQALDDLYKIASDPDLQNFIRDKVRPLAVTTKEAADTTAVAAQIAEGFGSTLTDLVAEALGLVTTRLEDTAEAQDEQTAATDKGKTAAENYAEAMGKLIEQVPSLKSEMDDLKRTTNLMTSAWTAFVAAVKTGDLGNVIETLKAFGTGMGGLFQGAFDAENQRINGIVSGGVVGKIIGIESGGDPNAANPNSSATGLGQFIESTWLSLFKKYFPSEASGMTDAAILELRKNSEISTKMVEYYLAENAKILRSAGVAVNDASLYLAHFLGPGGATAVLRAAPGTPVSSILSADQIAANQSILGGKTAGDVIAWAQGKMGTGRDPAQVEREIDLANAMLEARRKAAEESAKATAELQKQRDATEQQLVDMGMENDLLQMKIDGQTREAFILEGLNSLRRQNKEMTEDQVAYARELLGEQYDLNQALAAEKDTKDGIAEAEKLITDLQSQRDALKEQRDIYAGQGNTGMVEQIDSQLAGVNSQLLSAIDSARAMYAAMGGPEAAAAIANLDTLKLKLGEVEGETEKTRFTLDELKSSIFGTLENGVVNVFKSFAEAIANGENAVKALGTAFRQMAADVLIQLGEMIIKQLMFNMLSKLAGGLGGFVMGVGSLHTGGIAGVSSGSGTRQVSPAWFSNAMRYHSGGIAGLKPNEIPAVLKVGEEVLTETDPRHSRNINAGGGKSSTKVVNMFDASSFLSEALKNVIGEEAILNYVRANPSAFRQAMGG